MKRCSTSLAIAAAAAKSLQLCPTLCDPRDGSPPGSLSLGFSRQEHWSGLPFPSPMHERKNEVVQSCPTLSDPMNCSLPGSSVHGIFQARVLKWIAIAFSVWHCYFLQIPLESMMRQFFILSLWSYNIWQNIALFSPWRGQVNSWQPCCFRLKWPYVYMLMNCDTDYYFHYVLWHEKTCHTGP